MNRLALTRHRHRRPGPTNLDPSAAGGLAFLEAAVAATWRIPRRSLGLPERGGAEIACARQAAMYLAHVALGFSLTAAAACYGRDRTTAAHACRRFEEGRDDPQLDRTLLAIESGLSVWRAAFASGGAA